MRFLVNPTKNKIRPVDTETQTIMVSTITQHPTHDVTMASSLLNQRIKPERLSAIS